jgi:hypothetical protein
MYDMNCNKTPQTTVIPTTLAFEPNRSLGMTAPARRLPIGAAMAISTALAVGAPAFAVDGVLRGWGLNTDGQITKPAGLGTVKQAAGGAEFTIARLSDDSVRCWGSNDQLQTDVPSDVLEVIWIDAGERHALAILAAGGVRCWGDNSGLQCDVPGDLTAATRVAGGALHSMALTPAGAVRCWGDNSSDQCTIPGTLGTASEIDAGSFHSMALTTTGTVVCWGRNNLGQGVAPGDLGTVTAIAAGTAHNLAITSLGEVRCWGDNTDGQCTPPVGLTDVIAVAAGAGHSLALKSDGTVVGWGLDDNDQTTIPPNAAGSVAIAAGANHSLAINADPLDCDENGVPDEIEIRNDPDLDCTGDGNLDACTVASVREFADEVAPFNRDSVVSLELLDCPTPLLPVEINIEVKADLGSTLEFLILSINDTDIDFIFNAGGIDCATTPQRARILLDPDHFVALLDENRTALIELRASPFVSAAECPGSFANFDIEYKTDVTDCNGNDIADLCEVASGDVTDEDGDGIPDSCQTQRKGDQNRDGRADLTFFNPATRKITFAYLNGTTVDTTIATETAVASGWTPVAQGDFDADGQPDFLVRNNTTGANYIWLMDRTAIASFGEVGYALPSNIQVLAIGDADADGDDDIYWIDNNDKKVYVWRIAGSVLVGGGLVGNSVGTQFLGCGDIDDDGDDDLLFRNTTSRVTSAWIIQNAALSSTTPVQGGSLLGSEWEGRGMYDVNDDGKADLFLRNKNTGDLFCWYLDGATLAAGSGGQIGYNPGLSVDVVSVADIDGDGTADVLWKDVSGPNVYGWILNVRAFASGGLVRTLPTGSSVISP